MSNLRFSLFLTLFLIPSTYSIGTSTSCIKAVEHLLDKKIITINIATSSTGKISKVTKIDNATNKSKDLPTNLINILNVLHSNKSLKEKESILEDLIDDIYTEYFPLKHPWNDPMYLKDDFSDLNKFKFPYQVMSFYNHTRGSLVRGAKVSDEDYLPFLEKSLQYLARFILGKEEYVENSPILKEYLEYRENLYQKLYPKYKDQIYTDPREPLGY